MTAPEGTLLLVDLALEQTASSCDGPLCRSEALADLVANLVQLTRSTIARGSLLCTGDGCQVASLVRTDGASEVVWGGVSLDQGTAACFGTGCRAGVVAQVSSATGEAVLHGVAIEQSTAGCEGAGCTVRRVLEVSGRDGIEFSASRLQANEARCAGGGCRVEEVIDLVTPQRIVITNPDVRTNVSACNGAGCSSQPVVKLRADAASMTGGGFVENASVCDGAECAVGLGGAVHNDAHQLAVSGTTFSSNVTDGWGAAIFNAPGRELTVSGATLSGNQAGLRGTIPFAGAGGAIHNDVASGKVGVLRLVNSAIRNNGAAMSGGGILNEGTLINFLSLVDRNTPDDCVNFGPGTGC